MIRLSRHLPRARRRQRHRVDPGRRRHRLRRALALPARGRRRHLHVGLRPLPTRAVQALRAGQESAVERHRPAVGHRRRRRGRRHARWPAQSTDLRVTPQPTSTARPMKAWTQKEWTQFAIEAFNWRMSQFLHGEQGALICTAKIVETVPWIDAKYYAATQVVDEARHVEVFARYLDTKLDGHYPVNPALQLLHRRRHRRLALGHDLHGHADHDRGSRARGVRVHAHGHRRSRCSSSCCAT